MKLPLWKGTPNKARAPQQRLFQLMPIFYWDPVTRKLMNWAVIFGSVLFCVLMLPTRFFGMELLGIGPNWLLIWVVAWSVKRSVWEGIFAGVVLGLLQDAMTSPEPTHAMTLGFVGCLTALLQKQRFIQEDFISIALIVFVMAIVSETIFGLQLSWMGNRNVEDIWAYYQRGTLASAILSSLWGPVVYYPLNIWWQKCKL
ncbi:rod shape-determining protein MreD [Nodularia harveyana UHCC-0300]|uniref:Rod shape-determining protein MreD n=1 Tax=Nodularia harveyana UHCC-0300 TaxID=2974287 RepID=A0ABU5UIS9_9CYAN|nr:rod shape-determining protein MreD [Nodularia harveyana]MEA5583478.1 rod shape-determining protein MreD [Nodularia harveyana UHCC-0300]